MNLVEAYTRASLSALLAIALTAASSLGSLAAPEQGPSPVANAPAARSDSEAAAVAVILTGEAFVNESKARSGATVASGSLIETGSEAATINLGALGRIELRPGVRVRLTYGPGMVDIRSECDNTYVAVKRGRAEIRRESGDKEIKTAGKDKRFNGEASIVTAGETDLLIDCGDCAAAAFIAAPGLGPTGVLALVGAGVAVAAGVVAGDESSSRPGGFIPPVTPIVP